MKNFFAAQPWWGHLNRQSKNKKKKKKKNIHIFIFPLFRPLYIKLKEDSLKKVESWGKVNMVKTFMHNVVKWPNIFKNLAVWHIHIWPFYNMHERVKPFHSKFPSNKRGKYATLNSMIFQQHFQQHIDFR